VRILSTKVRPRASADECIALFSSQLEVNLVGHLEEIFGGKDPIFDVQMRRQAHMRRAILEKLSILCAVEGLTPNLFDEVFG